MVLIARGTRLLLALCLQFLGSGVPEINVTGSSQARERLQF